MSRATPTAGKTPAMTADHKAALAAGREEARMVKAYLEALESVGPKRRGRKRTVESIKRRLTAIEKELETASALIRLQLTQERADLQLELSTKETPAVDLERRRADFVKVAKSYSKRKGIAYETWREFGVDAGTLREAGVTR